MEIAQKIREQRIAEAATKNLTRKLSLIARSMGIEIRGEGIGGTGFDGASLEQSFIDPWELENEEDFPTAEEGSGIVGWQFDALREGCNLQIVCFSDGHHVKVSYHGTIVYEENEGELLRYWPDDAWEDKINHWAEKGGHRKKQQDAVEKESRLELGKSLLNKLREELRVRWGI